MSLEIERVREIAERVAESQGLEIVEVEFRGGGKGRMLRVTLDKPGVEHGHAPLGVTHQDCANVSRELSTILDVEEVVPGSSYTLEVSSPGLDRKLARAADFARFTGSLVKLMTKQPVNGNRHLQGRLESFTAGRLTLEVAPGKKKGGPEGKLEIELGNVERANLVPEF